MQSCANDRYGSKATCQAHSSSIQVSGCFRPEADVTVQSATNLEPRLLLQVIGRKVAGMMADIPIVHLGKLRQTAH